MTLGTAEPQGASDPAANRGRILVVEDEGIIRVTLGDTLRDEGYEVIEAFNGDEAADILSAGVNFDLILSDVRMPGTLDGIGLVQMITGSQPALPVILTSAHLQVETALAAGAKHFVQKPYEIEKLLKIIEAELEKRE